ncbi:hypothetical protein [Segniliparus rugosus]|uniref:Uncharacterized protein n=1 Tax=Segniliparus rugosus (strain ATCC BAA-974 / DSM 45345 / CCUG 50838 / CIP 108380 / JCM 13579 / CDC 945) TaxID=679197 RepID=E5XRS1_SEGRC|nr:hypothetical protein [Segniliparus rugosus]EFV12936.1 hypothetical protein HMPREF9336_02193 [Segniliparus rugosus ATCC BAA-974]
MHEDHIGPQFDLDGIRGDPDEEQIENAVGQLPKPLVVRAVVVALANFVAAVTGWNLSTNRWLDAALAAYAVVAPAAVAVWLRGRAKPKTARAGRHRAA